MNARTRRQAAKAAMLDTLVSTCEQWDGDEFAGTAEALGVQVEDMERARDELAEQLYSWAVRITPLPSGVTNVSSDRLGNS